MSIFMKNTQMKQYTKTTITVLLVLSAVFTCCTKPASKKTTCTSTWHAYSAPSWAGAPYTPSHYGVINASTGSITSFGTFYSNPVFTQQGAYNSTDNSYYLLQHDSLFKIDASGTLTIYAPSDTSHHCASVLYNAFNHLMYCQMRSGTSATLSQISMAAGFYSATVVATPAHNLSYELYTPSNIAVDNTTGAMYLLTNVLTTCYVEKFLPGSTSTSVVASGTLPNPILEMRYNHNDSKLYAISLNADTSTFSFIKIDPSAGSIAHVANIDSFINVDFYSASFDACSSHYVISTTAGGSISSYRIFELDLTGTIVHTDTIASIYQGLTIVDY